MLLLESLAVPTEERTAILRLARAPSRPASHAPQSPPLTPAEVGLEDLSGRTIRGYALHERLSAGGFGVVYRAEQPGIGRAVAIKIILPQYANLPEFIRRFEAEAQIIARLEHPHIVPLHDFWREPGGAYLVMRYVPGGTLLNLLQRGPLALDTCAGLLDQVGAALAVAHRAGVVHRDLKPSNILLDGDGNAYLADFGIAKDLNNAELAEQTQPGAILGSPAYLSPEQIRDEPITPRSDIYSLGILLYELLTGAKPFRASTPGELIQKQISEPLPALHAHRSDLSEALDTIIQRATAKSPADRYPDVLSLVTDFRQVTNDQRPTTNGDGRQLAVGDQPVAAGEYATAVVELPDLANPYKGLRAFGEADAANFFGREALVARLLERQAGPEIEEQGTGIGSAEAADTPIPDPRPLIPDPRFLAVVGPSGSGKSSVVKAGLIPALRRGGLPGSERWFIAEMLPGAHPLEELELALLRLAAERPPNLAEQLARDERGLLRAARLVLPPDDESELLLVIDQFEEAFTLVEDETARAHFLASIVAAVADERSRVRVVITLRADFYDRPLLYPQLGELVRTHTEVVLPLTPNELEQTIVSPASRAGLILEPRLVAEIIKDVGDQPGALPLLQYALTELFERRDGRTLTRAAYHESGGVQGALARRAESIYTWLDEPAKAAARQLFLRLVTLGEGIEDTRRRTSRAELTALTNNHHLDKETRRQGDGANADLLVSSSPGLLVSPSSAMDDVIDRYGHARLLSFDRDPLTREPTVEVAHEALLREWGRLRSWLAESRADIRMQRLLAAAAAEWSNAERDPSYLLGGARLTQFEDWMSQSGLALTQDEREFLDAGLADRAERKAAEQARQQRELAQERASAQAQRSAANRLRYLVGALAIFLVVAISLSTYAFQQRGAADQQRRAAEANAAEAERQRGEAQANLTLAEAQRLAAEANRLVAQQGNVDVATLLAIRSLRTQYTAQGDEAIAGVSQLTYPERVLTAHTEGARRVRFSPDGRYLLSGGNEGIARLWDTQTWQELLQLQHPGAVLDVNFSPDGTMIVTSDDQGTVYISSVKSGTRLRQLVGHSDSVGGTAFSPDGRNIVTGSWDKTARLWDVQTSKEIRRFMAPESIVSLAFSPDGRTFATGGATAGPSSIQLWDAQTGELVRTLTGHRDYIRRLTFSPDGKRLLSAATDSSARLWDVETGAVLLHITDHTDWVHSVAFSPDGRTFLTCSNDWTIRLWDTATGKELRRLNAHSYWVNDVTFSPDGQLVASASFDATIRIWRIRGWPSLPQFVGHTSPVAAAIFTADGKTLITSSEDTTVRLWNAATGEEQKILSGQGSAIRSVALSPDGQSLATAVGDSAVHLWDMQMGEEVAALDTENASTL